MDAQRRQILKRLDAFDAGPTEDDRRAERQAAIQRAIEAEEDLKWGRLSAGIAGGISGRSVLPLKRDASGDATRLARHVKAEKGVPQAGLSTHSGSGVIWDSGCGPGPSRPVELTVNNTRTLLSRSARVWHESLTCPRRFRLSSTSSSALVIISGSPSRYSMRQVVHLA